MGVDSGDRIEFVELQDGGFAIKRAVDDVRSLKGLLRRADKPLSVEDMNAAIRSQAEIGRRAR
jgi:hypothetical protein